MKISFYVIAKNEIYWVEPCLVSIKDIADEIVFVDNGSTDGTLQKVEAIRDRHKMSIKIHEFPGESDLSEVRNFAISKCSNNWVFTWDADFVAYEDSSPHSLKRRLQNLERGGFFARHNQINIPIPIMRFFMGKSLAGEAVHVPNCILLDKRNVSITMHETRGWDKRRYRGPRKCGITRDPCFISVDVKSDRRHVLRRFRSKWRLYRAKRKISLADYIKKVAKHDLHDAKFIYDSKLVSFPFPVPGILAGFMKNPPYETIMKDGRVAGREFDYDRLRQLEL